LAIVPSRCIGRWTDWLGAHAFAGYPSVVIFFGVCDDCVGWAAANFRGWTVTLFGVAPLPALAPKGTPWAHEAGDIHNILVYVLLGFIVLHVLGAIYHYFIKRDQVVQRMLLASQS
jgi:cytochrome b561